MQIPNKCLEGGLIGPLKDIITSWFDYLESEMRRNIPELFKQTENTLRASENSVRVHFSRFLGLCPPRTPQGTRYKIHFCLQPCGKACGFRGNICYSPSKPHFHHDEMSFFSPLNEAKNGDCVRPLYIFY